MARNKYPEKTVEKILTVAETLFCEKGYDNTSMQDIINGLGGLTKGAVYHHFKSKEDIFEAVYRKTVYTFGENFKEVIDRQDLNGREKLELAFRNDLNNPAQERIIRLVKHLRDNPDGIDPKVEHMLIDYATNTMSKLMYIIIKEGCDDGSIKCDQPEELAEMIPFVTTVWASLQIIKVERDAYMRKLRFINKLFEPFGISIIQGTPNDGTFKSVIDRI